MVDRGSVDLNFAGAEITLEVGHVIHGIPQAEFHIGKQGEILFLIGFIGQCQFIYFTRSAHRDKIGEDGGNAVLFSFKNRVAKTVAAFVVVKFGLGRHPARIPYGISVLDKVVKTVAVQWYVVIAVSGQAKELRVFVKAVSSAGI